MKKMAALLLSFFLLTATQVCAKSEDDAKKSPSASSASSKRAAAKGPTKKTTAKRSPTSKQTSPSKKNPPLPTTARSPVATPAPEFVENTLLVMPYSRDDEDTQDLIKEVDGTITETIGEGNMTVWVVKFKDPKKFEEAEKKLAKDKLLKSVERDTVFNAQ